MQTCAEKALDDDSESNFDAKIQVPNAEHKKKQERNNTKQNTRLPVSETKDIISFKKGSAHSDEFDINSINDTLETFKVFSTDIKMHKEGTAVNVHVKSQQNAVSDVSKDHHDEKEYLKISKHNKQSELIVYDIILCDICGEVITKSAEYLKHMNKHTGKTPNKYTCGFCFQTFRRKTDFKKHKLTHDEDVSFNCNLCDAYFDEKTEFFKHKKAHGERKIPCKICGKIIGHRNNMKSHMSVHFEVKTFSCRFECGKSFKQSTARIVHEQCVYQKLRPHKCNLCSRRFFRPKNLKEHLRFVHMEEKLECTMCDKFFGSRNSYETHMHRTHGDRKHRCEYCNKMFAYSSDLKLHRKKHVSHQNPAKPKLSLTSCRKCGKELHFMHKLRDHRCEDEQKLVLLVIDQLSDALNPLATNINLDEGSTPHHIGRA